LADQPPQDTNAERRRWRSAWRLTVLAFIALLAACAYWIVSPGFAQALATIQFQWAAFAAVLAGILVLGRFTVRALTRGIAFDRRNATTMDLSRPGWFMRWARRDRDG
jgi:hypothetical protein